MPAVRWEVKHVTRFCDLLLAFNEEAYPPALDDSHLLVRMIVFGGYQKWTETKAADHHPIAHKHLTLDSLCNALHRNRRPVQMLRQPAMAIAVRLILW
jgi:hypothetical protein